MKKGIIAIIAAMLLLVACGGSAKKEYEIDTNAVIEKIENKESFILYIGASDCSACQQFSPTFEEASKDYPETMYYVEYNGAQASSKDEFTSLEDNHIGKVTATPSIYVIKDGAVAEKRMGVLRYSELETFVERFELNK